MAETEIKFDAQNHIYTLGNKIVPSVTTILKEVAITNAFNHSEIAALRGTYVHKAVYLHHTSGLNLEKLDSELKPYLDAYFDFLEKTGFKFVSGEQIVFNPTYFYAGTYDLIGQYDNDLVLIDVKTGTAPNWGGLQLAGYREALPDPKPTRRFVLNLTKEGKWTLLEFTKATDAQIFFSAAVIVNWKMGRV